MKHILIAFFILAIVSCKQNTTPEVKTAPSQSEGEKIATLKVDLNETETKTEVTFNTEEATQVHEAYLELKGALVNTDAAEAAEVAQEFEQMLAAVKESATITKLKNNLAIIAKSQDAGEQRVAFENASINVENYLSGAVESGMLIKQFCPMAFEGKGAYWLSDSKEIRNPYYGNKMLKCGVVDKEID